jgi:hypothetical protein
VLQHAARGVPLHDPWLGDRRQRHGIPLDVVVRREV